MTAQGLRRLALGYFIGAFACGVYVALEHEAEWSELPPLEGAYYNRENGQDAQAFLIGDWFDPLQLDHPYLWLGVGAGFLITGLSLLVCAQLAGRRPAS